MGFVVTSRKFYDEFTGTGGLGVTYLNALQGDKITCEIEGYFYWALTNSKLTFSATDKSIRLSYSPMAQTSQTSFITQGFTEGDTIEIVGSPSNDGTYTIDTISDSYITTIETLNTETAPSCSIYGTTLVTDIDFYYDLIPNNSTKFDFISATDKNTVQKYSATGLDSAVTTPAPMTIGTQSYGWVTDIVTGEDGEGFIEGVSNADYKQSFKITQVFYMTRMWTKELVQNFVNRIAPAEYEKGNHLKHICKIDGKYDKYNPIIPHTGQITQQKGQSGWFNQMNNQSLPEYSVLSVQYQNNATSEYIDEIDGSIVNLVTMSISSRSGKFLSSASQFILSHFLCPLSEADYVDTETTLLENIRLDKAIITSDSATINGINYGTDYQSIKDIAVVWESDSLATLTFKVDYSTATKTILENKSVDDRYYAFIVSCQDATISTTKNIDRVNVIADFKNADYDLRETANFELVDYIHCYTFPNYGVFESNNVSGFQGDPAYIEIPFRIETAVVQNTSPTLKTLKVEVVATKTDEDDFVLESKSFDTSLVRKLNNKQTINIENSRGFIYATDSPWNRADLIRDEANDSGTMSAYLLRYAFALRYEEWLEVVMANDGASYDIFKDIEDVVEAWKRYSTGYGWVLNLRMTAEVEGYNEFVTTYTTETTFDILEEVDPSQDGIVYATQIKYYNEDAEEIEGILKDAPTRIVARFGGDPTTFPTGMTEFNGYIFVDSSEGSIFTRRIASSDFDSETDSPFSVTDLPTLNGVVSEFESANLRLSVFGNRIELDTWYTPIIGATNVSSFAQSRLGHQQANILLQEDGYALQQEDNFFILL